MDVSNSTGGLQRKEAAQPPANLNAALDQLGKEWKEFRDTEIERSKKFEKGLTGVSDLETKLSKIEPSIAALQASVDAANAERKAAAERIDRLEAERESIGGKKLTEKQIVQHKHLEAFENWVRDRKNPEKQQALRLAEKAASVSTTAASGGYAIPEILDPRIFEQAQLLSPVRRHCLVVPAANSDIRFVVDKGGTGSGWVAEAGTRSATTTPDLRERVPTFGTLYSYVSATEESLNDIGFDAMAWLANRIAFRHAQAEGISFLTGDGSSKPTGMLNTTPVTTNDGASPERAAAALEYVPLDPGASPSVNIQAIAIFELIYTLRAPYRAMALFAANSLTLARLRKLRDTTGQFLWQPSLQAGQPALLAGYPIEAWEDLADVALNANSVLFGDFRSGYVIVDLAGQRQTIDDNITTPGLVKFYVRRRLGGCVLDNNAIKVGRIAAA